MSMLASLRDRQERTYGSFLLFSIVPKRVRNKEPMSIKLCGKY